ncbi:MAG TPA: tetratricopeptide repeat protein, partial [Vineibacter sp.]|nr:tetratricopeptide repeat protein [Vineibacter sp.]
FRHVADNGYPEGALALGDLLAATAMAGRGDPARDAAAKAVGWYTSAANAGVALAQFKLANALFSGAGAERDLPKAEQWYMRAAQQGLADAQYVLGVWKSGGVAGPKDPVDGYRWLLLAERQGESNAAKVRQRVRDSLSPEDRRAAEMAADAFRAKAERPRNPAAEEAPLLRPMKGS